jgi:hypothetical protein
MERHYEEGTICLEDEGTIAHDPSETIFETEEQWRDYEHELWLKETHAKLQADWDAKEKLGNYILAYFGFATILFLVWLFAKVSL